MPILESIFHYKDFQCAVVFQMLGHRCGYVKIPLWHPMYEKDYYEFNNIKCHGGITYGSHTLLGKVYRSGWWIGFDCAHIDDAPDSQSMLKYFNKNIEEQRHSGYVKTLDFCRQECKNIVDQLIQMVE